jgi:hypothetical protein
MNLIICDSKQRRLEGVVLAAGQNRIRVAIRGGADVTELHREYSQWTLETGEPVNLELLLGDSQSDMFHFLQQVYPRYYTA